MRRRQCTGVQTHTDPLLCGARCHYKTHHINTHTVYNQIYRILLILKTYNASRNLNNKALPYPHCSCNTLKNADARNCALPPRSLSPSEPNNGCGCSLMRRDIVEQFPGDICGESLGMPTPSAPHTSPLHPLSLATAVVRALQREIKKRLLLSPCRRDGRLFLSFFFFMLLHSLHTHRKGSERGEEKKITAWGEKKETYTAIYCVPWRSTTSPMAHPLLHHQLHPQHPQ